MQDDETYLKRDFRQLSGLKYFVSTTRGNVPSKYKFICQDKFAKKYLIWFEESQFRHFINDGPSTVHLGESSETCSSVHPSPQLSCEVLARLSIMPLRQEHI
jgi:hypothetical protein